MLSLTEMLANRLALDQVCYAAEVLHHHLFSVFFYFVPYSVAYGAFEEAVNQVIVDVANI